MNIKTLILLIFSIVLAFPDASTFAISSKSLKLEQDEDAALIEAQKEIQNLLGRIEVLEHNVAVLGQRLMAITKVVESNLAPVEANTESPELQNLPRTLGVGMPGEGAENIPGKSDIRGDIFDSALEGVPNNGANNKEEKILAAPNVQKSSKDKQLYDLALAALKDNKLEQANNQFASFIKTYPKSPLQSNAYFWYGETFFKRSMFNEAAVNYLKGYKQFPKSAKAADSLLKLALSLGELGKKSEACGILGKLESEFPSRPAAAIKRAKDAKIKFGCK